MDYKNGKIYTIRSHQTDKYYIGSTCTMLSKRLSKHKSKYKYNSLDCTSRDILKYDDFYIELLEAFECKNKNELRQREGELIRKYKDNIVNCRIENRTIDEWRGDNKEKIKQYHKQYYDNNKEKIKQYKSDNKDKIKQYKSQYYNDNKEKIKQCRIDNKYNCECGGKYTIANLSIHQKTKKHQKFLKQ